MPPTPDPEPAVTGLPSGCADRTRETTASTFSGDMSNSMRRVLRANACDATTNCIDGRESPDFS